MFFFLIISAELPIFYYYFFVWAPSHLAESQQNSTDRHASLAHKRRWPLRNSTPSFPLHVRLRWSLCAEPIWARLGGLSCPAQPPSRNYSHAKTPSNVCKQRVCWYCNSGWLENIFHWPDGVYYRCQNVIWGLLQGAVVFVACLFT